MIGECRLRGLVHASRRGRPLETVQRLLHDRQQRILSLSAECAVEIVEIQRPDHGTGEPTFGCKPALLLDRLLIIVADPLLVLVGVGRELLLVVLDMPLLLLRDVADFEVREKASGGREVARQAGTFRRAVGLVVAVLLRLHFERAPVHAETENELRCWTPAIDPRVHGGLLIEQTFVTFL